MDRFSNGLPDAQEKEPQSFTQCGGCSEDVYEGELIINVYGMIVHYDMNCLLKATDAHVGRAGEEDKE